MTEHKVETLSVMTVFVTNEKAKLDVVRVDAHEKPLLYSIIKGGNNSWKTHHRTVKKTALGVFREGILLNDRVGYIDRELICLSSDEEKYKAALLEEVSRIVLHRKSVCEAMDFELKKLISESQPTHNPIP